MKLCTLLFFTMLMPVFLSPVWAEKIVKETMRSQGKERAYYLFVSEKVNQKSPAPLIVLLHGSGRNGLSLVEKWKDLANKEGLILVGPDAQNSRGWKIPEDGPGFVHELIETLKARYPVNTRRMYLFGHSAGAGQVPTTSWSRCPWFEPHAMLLTSAALNQSLRR